MGRNSIWERGCIRFGEIRRGNDSLGKSNRSEFVPEINRFRREIRLKKTWAYESGDRVWIPACAGITGREGASAFAEFLTYMASLREGSRGEEVTAMGGWQWGRGREWKIGRGGGRFFTSLRYVQNDMLWCEGGWVPASARTRGLGVDSRFRLHGGGTCAGGRGWGWVPASGDLCITVIPALSQNPEVGI